MRNIRLSKSCIGKEEIDAVTDVLHREYLGMGQDVHKFEDDLKDFFGRDVTLVNTGTAALHLAVQGVGIKDGDEVLVQSLTYVACFQAKELQVGYLWRAMWMMIRLLSIWMMPNVN